MLHFPFLIDLVSGTDGEVEVVVDNHKSHCPRSRTPICASRRQKRGVGGGPSLPIANISTSTKSGRRKYRQQHQSKTSLVMGTCRWKSHPRPKDDAAATKPSPPAESPQKSPRKPSRPTPESPPSSPPVVSPSSPSSSVTSMKQDFHAAVGCRWQSSPIPNNSKRRLSSLMMSMPRLPTRQTLATAAASTASASSSMPTSPGGYNNSATSAAASIDLSSRTRDYRGSSTAEMITRVLEELEVTGSDSEEEEDDELQDQDDCSFDDDPLYEQGDTLSSEEDREETEAQ